ncbi:MAG: four helix bundle protein [Crocinitomicaceae bacterium]|nr:four helix bundle protein [Crocinitomicaceae bacterium]
MAEIKTYKDLLIWQNGILLAEHTYMLTNEFPIEEIYSLTSQIKRSAVSISSNIAEGYGRNSTKSYVNFLKIARGSLYELETQLILAEKFNYISNKTLLNEVFLEIEVESKMLNSFIKKVDNIN